MASNKVKNNEGRNKIMINVGHGHLGICEIVHPLVPRRRKDAVLVLDSPISCLTIFPKKKKTNTNTANRLFSKETKNFIKVQKWKFFTIKC